MCVGDFFLVRQKSAYEVSACLVGSEMYIVDRSDIKKNKKNGRDAGHRSPEWGCTKTKVVSYTNLTLPTKRIA